MATSLWRPDRERPDFPRRQKIAGPLQLFPDQWFFASAAGLKGEHGGGVFL
jgi:hypothetical protein